MHFPAWPRKTCPVFQVLQLNYKISKLLLKIVDTWSRVLCKAVDAWPSPRVKSEKQELPWQLVTTHNHSEEPITHGHDIDLSDRQSVSPAVVQMRQTSAEKEGQLATSWPAWWWVSEGLWRQILGGLHRPHTGALNAVRHQDDHIPPYDGGFWLPASCAESFAFTRNV